MHSTCFLSVLSVFTSLQTVGFQFLVSQFSVFGFASFHFPETAGFHEVLQRSTINSSEIIFLPMHGGSNGRGVSFLLDTGGRLSGIFAQWFLMMDDRVLPGEVFDQLISGSIDLVSQTSRAHARWISNGAGNPIEARKPLENSGVLFLFRSWWKRISRSLRFPSKTKNSASLTHCGLLEPVGQRL